ncbi:MAG: ribonucleoside triphosphate reductase [Anaerolineaceae bacterium]|nr:ribonucleoside triphosphate reductase [Anaerolineaceae bacterium]
MIETVLKRNGTQACFDLSRIEQAVLKASTAVNAGQSRQWAEMIALAVLGHLSRRALSYPPSVEEIQDIVEEVLIKSGYPRIAKAYILYREKRNAMRNSQALMFDAEKLVEDYLQISDWRVRENSNMNYSLQGLNYYLASTIAANYWLEKIFPAEVQFAHREGEIHIHDLGLLSVYCCGWDLYDLLIRGFSGVKSKVESKPPKHFRTALGQLVNFFYTMQGESAGAVAVSNFDTLMAPFIRYDGLDYAAVKQAMQEFIFNINVPTRVGFQTPFTNLTMDLYPPSTLKDQAVIIGGEMQNETYADFAEEMLIINRAFAEIMLEGDACGRVFTFPIPTYNVTPDFPWEEEALQPLWEMTARYGIPYFANFINSDMKAEDARSMCCRLRLDNRELQKRMGGLFASAPLTGSVGVVTLNLARIGYTSDSKESFFAQIERLMHIARTCLEIKRKTIEQFTAQGLYPYSKVYLASVEQRSGKFWTNHFSTIGIIGMHEACMNLFGKSIAEDESVAFAQETMQFMLDTLQEFQLETGNLYNLEATPAEGATYRLAKMDKVNFPGIITSGTDETPFYTNSTQLPVHFSDDLFEVLDHQDQLQPLYSGGTVQHLFLGERISDYRQARKLIQVITRTYRLPYLTLTPTFSICPVHGYLAGEHAFCPHEHSTEDLARFGVPVNASETIIK